MTEDVKIAPGAGFDDFRAVARLAELYLTGAKAGGSALMRAAFDPAATVRGTIGGKAIDLSLDAFFAFVDGKPAPDVTGLVAAIDLCGGAGTMRVECHDWNGVRYTDFFTVLKRDGAWRIAAKVFYAHPRAKEENAAT